MYLNTLHEELDTWLVQFNNSLGFFLKLGFFHKTLEENFVCNKFPNVRNCFTLIQHDNSNTISIKFLQTCYTILINLL